MQNIKEKIIAEVEMMRKENGCMPVKGERKDIDLGDRKINVVYYTAELENAPLFLAFHGGGFLFGGNALDDAQWDYMRKTLNVNIASVEYRKSPEFRWKDALDDAYDTFCYFYGHAYEFGFNADKIYAYGASAGANLAAALCIYAKQKGNLHIYKQILMYPFLDCATNPDEKGEGSLSGPIMHIFNELHCDSGEAKNPLISPVFADVGELNGLPESVMVMADHDNLKHEGYRYAELLAKAGVGVHFTSCPGMPHGFIENAFADPESGIMDFMGEEGKELLLSGRMYQEAEKAYTFVKNNL